MLYSFVAIYRFSGYERIEGKTILLANLEKYFLQRIYFHFRNLSFAGNTEWFDSSTEMDGFGKPRLSIAGGGLRGGIISVVWVLIGVPGCISHLNGTPSDLRW